MSLHDQLLFENVPLMMAPKHCKTGFTLPELLTVLSIIAILAAMAGPSFSSMIAKQRVKMIAADLYVALSKARSEAIKRNNDVRISPNTAYQWEAGWFILDPTDATRKLEDRNAISGATIVGPASLTYRGSGRIIGTITPTFDVSASGDTTHWCVSVDLSGRPYQKKSSC